MPTKHAPDFAPVHIAAFGHDAFLGAPRTLFRPEPEEGAGARPDAETTRRHFINEEKAKQLDKSVEYLAGKNAELQWDLNQSRQRFNPETHVAVSREDALALQSYREQFPTPKDAKDAKSGLGALQEKDTLRSYDEKRAELLAKYPDLPEPYKAAILKAEELKARPGGDAQLRDLALLEADVERFAKSAGVVAVDPAAVDVGASPASVRGGGTPVNAESEGKKAGVGFWTRDITKKE